MIISYFKEKVPNSVFTSNPCRIKYCTKEIVILRQDIMTKIVRNSLNHPTGVNHADCVSRMPVHQYNSLRGASSYFQFVSTLIGQSHLCPLPLHICPVYWSYDHALSLYPLPNLVIIGDKGDPFSIQKYGCHFVNPVNFTIYYDALAVKVYSTIMLHFSSALCQQTNLLNTSIPIFC